MIGPKLEASRVAAAATIDFPQLSLQVQAPDLRIIGQFIAVQGEAFNDGVEDRLSHKGAMKRALGFNGRRLFAGHSGGEE